MKSYDYDCVAYDSDYYCVQCLPKGIEPDNEEVMPVFADSEMDSYPSCCQCGGKHEYMGLTSDGIVHEATAGNHAEIFEVPASTFANSRDDGSWHADAMESAGVDWDDAESVKAESEALAGWYWWTCLPGCMPDSDAMGPFKSELKQQPTTLDYEHDNRPGIEAIQRMDELRDVVRGVVDGQRGGEPALLAGEGRAHHKAN